MTRLRGPYGAPSKTELVLAAHVHDLGLTFTTDDAVPCGTKSNGQAKLCVPDLLFRHQWVAVFLDGCYWHRCPDHAVEDARAAAIREKDAAITAGLKDAGWEVVRLWEHDDLEAAAQQIVKVIYDRHVSRKAIHHIDLSCRHRNGSWCDYCSDEPHELVPDGEHCKRCGLHAKDHDDYMVEEAMIPLSKLAEDITLISRRSNAGHLISMAEIRELVTATAQIAKQFSI